MVSLEIGCCCNPLRGNVRKSEARELLKSKVRVIMKKLRRLAAL
jgi:hypothetical protein